MPRPKTRNDDLRGRLLMESLELLESEGSGAVTARRVATVAGTSTAAVYELFGNKAGLVRSIFYEGFERLSAILDVLEPTGDPERDVVALFDATRSFAVRFPMLFEVMYARPFADFEPTEDDYRVAKRIYDHVVRRVAALLGTQRNDQVTVDAAHALVALNRGLIASELGGVLGRSTASIARRRTVALSATIAGLRETSF